MLVRLQSLPHRWRVLTALGLIVLAVLLAGSVPASATAQDAVVDQSPPVFAAFESILWSAADANGAEVNYDPPRAYDDVDGEVGVDCDYPTGSWFGLGDTLVTCYAQDSTGNSSGIEFFVSVVDRDAPALNDRDDVVTYTDADSAGTTVDYAPPLAYDNVDGEFEASCDIPPGSYFPVGESEIACYANDAVGNAADPTYFFIVVVDDDAPTLYDRDDISASATDGSGRVIEFNAPDAVDNVDGDVASSCDWASGAVFPLGSTEVTCFASDNVGNKAQPISFLVTIYDDVAPTISGGSNIEVQAGSAEGDDVSFAVPEARDDVSGSVGVGCDPESGAFFPVGTTTVTCYATDDAGNEAAPVSFTVTVFAPPVPTEVPTKAPTKVPTEAPTKAPTQPATGTTEPEAPGEPEEPETPTTPTSTSSATAPATEPAGSAPTAEPTSAATSPAQPETPTTGTEEPEENVETPAARPTAPPMELPFPPPGFVPITGNGPLGSLTGIWGYQSFGISQEFGHTAFSMSHSSWYAYGRNYGLDGRMHTGLDVSMPAGTYLYSPVEGVVTVSGGTPYFTFYGNGQPGVGQLTITTAGGHQVILGHMARIQVGVGERVQPGQFVGLSGGENGDHLHLEARERQRGGGLVIVDPRQSFLTGLAGTFRLSGGPAALAGGPAGNSVGGLVAQTIFESTDKRLRDSLPVTPVPTKPTTSPTPPATSTPTPGTTPPATPKPTQPPVVVNPNPQPTNPPVVVRPNPRPSSPPIVVRPNPPTSTAGPVVVTNPTGSTGGTGGAPVTVVSPGVGSSASAPGTATTVVSTSGAGAEVGAVTTVTSAEGVATTQTAVVTTAVQPGVVVGPAAIKANLPASRVKTPLVVTNPSLGEVNQPAQSTLGPVSRVVPGPTVATTGTTGVTTAPTVVTTAPQVVTTAPVTGEGTEESTDQPAQTQPTVVITEPTTTAPTAPVVVVNAPAVVVSDPNKETVGPAPIGAPAAASAEQEDDQLAVVGASKQFYGPAPVGVPAAAPAGEGDDEDED